MIACPHCAEQIPELGNYCPYCKSELSSSGSGLAAPSSAVSNDTSRQGKWGGWDADRYFMAWLITGLVGGIVTGAASTSSNGDAAMLIGYVVLGASSLFLLIGCIAKGVEVGIRAARD